MEPVTLPVGDGPRKGGARNPDRKQHDKYQFMLSVHDPHNTIANQNYWVICRSAGRLIIS